MRAFSTKVSRPITHVCLCRVSKLSSRSPGLFRRSFPLPRKNQMSCKLVHCPRGTMAERCTLERSRRVSPFLSVDVDIEATRFGKFHSAERVSGKQDVLEMYPPEWSLSLSLSGLFCIGRTSRLEHGARELRKLLNYM